MANTSLNKANTEKFDEFYTQLSDVEKELKHYTHHFKNKVIYCNCDDPDWSNFWKYFDLNFEKLGLKKLIATHYDKKEQSYKLEKTSPKGKYKKTPLELWKLGDEYSNGDFRSPECISILSEADIVVTNPPFSLFREYIKQLIDYEKYFLIIGNLNALKYKEIFPYILEGKVWLGATYFNGGAAYFKTFAFDESKANKYEIKNGEYFVRVNGVRWYTNLDHKKRHEEIILYKTYTGNEKDYPKYDNYDAINVDKVKDIPIGYDGIIGVPISFFDKWNQDQFEIIGMTDRQNTSGVRTKIYTIKDTPKFNDLNRVSVLRIGKEYKTMYSRILIKHRKQYGN